MPSVPEAEPRRSRPARPTRPGGSLRVLAVLAVCLSLLLVGGCSREVDVPPPRATQDDSAARAAAGQAAVGALVAALDGGTRDQAVALAARSSRDLLGQVWDNTRSLRLDRLSARYVDEAGPLPDDQRAQYGTGAWRATVDLAYAYAGIDQRAVSLETQVVLVPSGSGARIAAFGGSGSRTPLWLLGPLDVARTARALVVVEDGDDAALARYRALATRAVQQVDRVLSQWRGTLVLEVPADRATLDELVQASPGQYDDIAAVTTTADGSLATGAPVRVFVNPAVFDGLKPRGAQVVLSHETTHVAVGAPFADVPTWLGEGFADYVALDGTGIPVQVAASQILARIRADGLPAGLPTAADLEPTATGLGATYEEAWLACRSIGELHGTDGMVAFYRAVAAGRTTQQAFRSVLGTSQAEFVASWRRELARLAGVAR